MYVSWGLDHTILKSCWKYTDSLLSFILFIVLYVCCMLHVAHFVFWITLYNGFLMLYRFASLFLFYCTLCMLHVACCFGSHYIMGFWCYTDSLLSFCFIVPYVCCMLHVVLDHTIKWVFVTHTHTHAHTHTPVYVGQFWIGSHYLKVLLKKCLFSFLSVLLYTRWRFLLKIKLKNSAI